jgi:UDP-glucose 4-epimerase
MKRVLVTGGSGFIGSHVVDRLAADGIEPRIYDLRHSPHHLEGAIDTVVGDLRDTDSLCHALRGCDSVIHLAASADVGIVAAEPVAAEQTNARGTISVLEAARSVGVERVVYGSTIWVYGESGEGTIDEESPVGLPKHLYTASKLAGEMYCTSYEELYDVPYTILRFGIPYGPRSRPAAVIPIFVRKALAGEPLTIAGDGLQTRRFVYVEDLAEGVVRGLRPPAANRVYNLASNETVTIRRLADVVGEVVGSAEIVHTPGRNGDFGGAEISNVRAKDELGWSADTPLGDGVSRYLDWLREAPAEELEPAPATVPIVASTVITAAAPDEAAIRPRAGERFPIGTWAVAVAVGTLLAALLSVRTDDFGTGQTSTVIFVALIAIVASVSSRRTWSGAIAWGLTGLYVVLMILPATHHALNLAIPHIGTLVLAALGAVAALGIAAASDRIPAPETVTEPSP